MSELITSANQPKSAVSDKSTFQKPEVYVNRFLQIRNQSELFCKNLQTEDYVVQPVVDVSPPKWHLAHTTWFFENFILKVYKPGYQVFHPEFGYLFNSYYESVGKRVLRTNRGNLTRPGVQEIYRYREYVNTQIQELLTENLPQQPDFFTTFELGLQHEQQHQELLVTDVKYILGHNPLFPALFEKAGNAATASVLNSSDQDFLHVPSGLHAIGFKDDGFCFDNELGAHQVLLPEYRIMSRLITNAEYLEFMNQGGYRNFSYWLAEGWDWVQQNNIEAPMYWYQQNQKWHTYTLQGIAEVNLQEPVTHICFYEADAFARWKGKRLPTEFEWEAACRIFEPVTPPETNFLESGNYQPVAITGNQFRSNCWEWTNSAYLPYPHYQKADGALGEYNGKFMVNQMVLRGGSCATPESHFRPSYRNFFHPHLQWQFTGIRLAEHV